MELSAEKPYAASRSAAILTLLSVLGPVSGLVMEMVLAWRYGASSMIDAFRVSTLVMVLGMQLFFSYLLPHVIVPLFSEYRTKGLEHEGWRLAFSITLILSLISLIFIVWVWLDPDALVGLLGPGLTESGREDAALLMRCFSLAFLLMACSGVISGMLYVYRVFWLSAVAQMLPNCFVILSVLLIGREWGAGALASGILLGYAAMLFLFAYALLRKSRETRISLLACLIPGPRDGLLKAFYLSLPLLAAIFIGQWGIIIINRVLSEMSPGTLAEFGYAWKLLALVGLLPAALATVIFPAFAEAHASDNPTELSRLVTRAFRMTLFLTVPLATVLFVERFPIVSLLFGRGGMSEAAMSDIRVLFGILLIGAPANALGVALSKVAFSMHDTKSPTIVAFISALAISILVPYAAGAWGAIGVAWASSAIAWGVTLTMLGYLIARYRIVSVWEVLRYSIRLAVLSVGVAMPAIAIRALSEPDMPSTFGSALFEMTVAGLIAVVAGYVLSRILGICEPHEIGRYIKWQLLQIPFIKNPSAPNEAQ